MPGLLHLHEWVLWQVLQWVSTAYVKRVLGQTSSMNQTFGLVLGLVGLIFVAAVIAVPGIELNVVIARRLWPRALLTPFTDAVDRIFVQSTDSLAAFRFKLSSGYRLVSRAGGRAWRLRHLVRAGVARARNVSPR